MADLWALERGAQLLPDNSVRFTVWAPLMATPTLRLLSGAAKGDYPLAPLDGQRGVYTTTVPGLARTQTTLSLLPTDGCSPIP